MYPSPNLTIINSQVLFFLYLLLSPHFPPPLYDTKQIPDTSFHLLIFHYGSLKNKLYSFLNITTLP